MSEVIRYSGHDDQVLKQEYIQGQSGGLHNSGRREITAASLFSILDVTRCSFEHRILGLGSFRKHEHLDSGIRALSSQT